MKNNKILAIALTAGMLLSAVTACTPGNDPVESSAQNTTVVTTESEASAESTTEATTETSTESSEDTKATESSEDTKATESSEDTKATESSEDTKPTEKPSDNKGGIENQKYCNTFLTNFAEQYFHGSGEKFDVQDAKIDDVLRFALLHIKINSYKTLGNDSKGECTYTTFTFEKAQEVIGKYMSYLLKEEDCKELPAPPETIDDQQYGPYYADGKIWFASGDGESYTDIAVADSIKFNEEGTATINFTVYSIDIDAYNALDDDGIKKYYQLTPDQASSDKTLTKRGTGVANVDIGQSGKYVLRTYEVKLG